MDKVSGLSIGCGFLPYSPNTVMVVPALLWDWYGLIGGKSHSQALVLGGGSMRRGLVGRGRAARGDVNLIGGLLVHFVAGTVLANAMDIVGRDAADSCMGVARCYGGRDITTFLCVAVMATTGQCGLSKGVTGSRRRGTQHGPA